MRIIIVWKTKQSKHLQMNACTLSSSGEQKYVSISNFYAIVSAQLVPKFYLKSSESYKSFCYYFFPDPVYNMHILILHVMYIYVFIYTCGNFPLGSAASLYVLRI